MSLIRYWFEFEADPRQALPFGIPLGCGVTAYSYEDALAIINEKVFQSAPLPQIKLVVENVDVSTLDSNHIQPNMELAIKRGVWFPLGYD